MNKCHTSRQLYVLFAPVLFVTATWYFMSANVNTAAMTTSQVQLPVCGGARRR